MGEYQDSAGVYSGELKNGVPYGVGMKMYHNGMIYDGNWVDGARHGVGILEIDSIIKIRGEFNKGTLINLIEVNEHKVPSHESYPFLDVINSTIAITRFNGSFYEEDGIIESPSTRSLSKYSEVLYQDQKVKRTRISETMELEEELENSVATGRAKQFIDGELYYEGEIKNGLRHGKGTLYSDGKIITGDFKNGQIDGEVSIIGGNFQYQGTYNNHGPHGKGILTKNDYTYEGDFKFGMMQGYGIKRFSGFKVMGMFENNAPKGKMTMEYVDHIYEGELNSRCAFHGHGKILFPDGTSKEADFNNMTLIPNRVKHFIYPLCFEGRMEMDKFVKIVKVSIHEKIFVVNFNKKSQILPYITEKSFNEYEKAKSSQKMSLYSHQASSVGSYQGEISKGKFNGKGKFMFKNGEIYEGQWESNKMHGRGTYYYKNNQVYLGDFFKNKREGKGQLTFPDGTKIKGTWKDDKLNGYGLLINGSNINEILWQDNKIQGYFLCLLRNRTYIAKLQN